MIISSRSDLYNLKALLIAGVFLKLLRRLAFSKENLCQQSMQNSKYQATDKCYQQELFSTLGGLIEQEIRQYSSAPWLALTLVHIKEILWASWQHFYFEVSKRLRSSILGLQRLRRYKATLRFSHLNSTPASKRDATLKENIQRVIIILISILSLLQSRLQRPVLPRWEESARKASQREEKVQWALDGYHATHAPVFPLLMRPGPYLPLVYHYYRIQARNRNSFASQRRSTIKDPSHGIL